jgi:hypothetical protein
MKYPRLVQINLSTASYLPHRTNTGPGLAILFTNQSLIPAAIYATILPHRRPSVYREPDREG